MRKRVFPEWFGPARQWRIRKRRELDVVLKALGKAQYGSAYFPRESYLRFKALHEEAKKLRVELRGEWKP